MNQNILDPKGMWFNFLNLMNFDATQKRGKRRGYNTKHAAARAHAKVRRKMARASRRKNRAA
jgi:hypothetical protein